MSAAPKENLRTNLLIPVVILYRQNWPRLIVLIVTFMPAEARAEWQLRHELQRLLVQENIDPIAIGNALSVARLQGK